LSHIPAITSSHISSHRNVDRQTGLDRHWFPTSGHPDRILRSPSRISESASCRSVQYSAVQCSAVQYSTVSNFYKVQYAPVLNYPIVLPIALTRNEICFANPIFRSDGISGICTLTGTTPPLTSCASTSFLSLFPQNQTLRHETLRWNFKVISISITTTTKLTHHEQPISPSPERGLISFCLSSFPKIRKPPFLLRIVYLFRLVSLLIWLLPRANPILDGRASTAGSRSTMFTMRQVRGDSQQWQSE
jgi:hypothetical protein